MHKTSLLNVALIFFIDGFNLKTTIAWILFTVKFLNFLMTENFAEIYLKIQTLKPNLRVFHQKDASGITNSVDPDQTAPLGTV